MSFFDSNGNKKLRSIGKVLRDIHTYTKFQGKQACNAVKATEVITSIKDSQFVSTNKSFFNSKSGAVKHQSLKEDDETILWRSEEDRDSYPNQPVLLNSNTIVKRSAGKSWIPHPFGGSSKKKLSF